MEVTSFEKLVGHTITDVKIAFDNSVLYLELANGEKHQMFHRQDCCESVYLEDVVGAWYDIKGHEILLAEVVTYDDKNPIEVAATEEANGYQDNRYRWTFYKLATNRGRVTLRWYGESNGYYSVEVDWA